MNAARLMMTNHFRVAMVAVAAVLAAFLLALVVRMEPSEAAFPGQNGKIAFISDEDAKSDWEIYTMNPDGSNPTNISNHPAHDDFPAWSPNGDKIAFSSDRDGITDIYIMNADGSNPTNITNAQLGSASTMPAWSPDGTKIAFRSFRSSDGNTEIYVMNADGSGQTNISNHPATEAFPAWSPDGTKIAFMSGRDGNNEIYTMNPDGSNQTNLTNNVAHDEQPDWSPDGTKIAFTRGFNLFTMNADGTGVTQLTSFSSNGDPAWSPDGTKIAFVGAAPDIHVMNADGSNPTNITNSAANEGRPDWQPTTAPINTAPTITNMRPAPGSTTTDRTPTIAATVTDAQTNLAKSNITLTLDGATIPRTTYSYNQSTDRMSYTPQKKLSLGQHTVKVVARDASGLSTPKSWSFKIVHP
jgi:TolB protein